MTNEEKELVRRLIINIGHQQFLACQFFCGSGNNLDFANSCVDDINEIAEKLGLKEIDNE